MAPSNASFFVISGPTACGKSELAMRIAELCNGEIVGADAFQIYEGLDILTAKPSREMRGRVAHHLIGEVPLSERFDVAQYAAITRSRIASIQARGKVAIVCGGTGLYVRALLRGLADLPGADAGLRAELEAQSLEQLQHRLEELDPDSFAQIDLRNPRRLIRAIEVCLLTGRPFSSFRGEWADAAADVRGVFLRRERLDLHSRIMVRTAAMFSAGVEEEVRAISEIGPTAVHAIGFREIKAHLAGEIGPEECMQAIIAATQRYAKRQMTWFRRETALEPISLSETSDVERLATTLAQRISSMVRR